MKKYDIIKFKTILLNKNVEDIGIIEEAIHENEIIYKVRPFNLKVFNVFVNENEIFELIGKYDNFDFTNDESNHNYKIDDSFYIQLNDAFYNEFLNDLGYFYWNGVNEMKQTFKNLDKIKCKISAYQGPYTYHVETNCHDLRLNEKLINKFKL